MARGPYLSLNPTIHHYFPHAGHVSLLYLILLDWYLLARMLILVYTVMGYTLGFNFILNVVLYSPLDFYYYWANDSLLESPPERQCHNMT